MASSCHDACFLILLLVSHTQGLPSCLGDESANLGKKKHANVVLHLLLLMLLLLLMQVLLLLELIMIILRMLHQLMDYPICNSINASEPCNYLTTASDN